MEDYEHIKATLLKTAELDRQYNQITEECFSKDLPSKLLLNKKSFTVLQIVIREKIEAENELLKDLDGLEPKI